MPDPRDYLGWDASWEQKRIFEWAWLEQAAPEFAAICRERINYYLANEFSEG